MVVVDVEVVTVAVVLKIVEVPNIIKIYNYVLDLPDVVVEGIEVFEQLQKSLRMANATVLHVSMQSGSE